MHTPVHPNPTRTLPTWVPVEALRAIVHRHMLQRRERYAVVQPRPRKRL